MEEIQTAINQEDPLTQSYNQAIQEYSQDPRNIASNTLISGNLQQENMVKWELELDSILERIEHMLRGDRPKMVKGDLIFVPPDDESEQIFNDQGVSELMRILTMYLNRNTILSNYDEETINNKMLDFGNELADLIYLKYEAFGLNDLEKRKRYPMIIRQIVDAVHSAYLRALNGQTHKGLKESRQVLQSENMSQSPQQFQPMKERGIFNPMRYIKGRYG